VNAGDAARAVAQALGLYDDVDRRHDHIADRARRQVEPAHGDHALDARQRLAGAVGVERSHRPVMAGVHGLQEVECLGAAHLADDDALGAHAQAVADQLAHGHLALSLQIGRAGLQPDHMGLLQLQFGGVLAGDDALVVADIEGHAVEQRGLARARAPGDQHIAARLADDLQDGGAFPRDRPVAHELFQGQLVLAELADRERGSVDGQRRHDDVDAAAVGQARVADRARLVDAASDLADDALADIHELRVVAEPHARPFDPCPSTSM
jgi:hypothetical protein